MKKKFESMLGPRLKVVRGGMSQSQMAALLGVPQQTYANWELGIRQPKLADLGAMSLQLGVSTDYLIGLRPKDESPQDDDGEEWRKRAQDAERKLTKVNEALGKVIEGTKALQEAVK